MKVKLTKRTIEAIPVSDRDVKVWDTEIPGFAVKVTPKGTRVYVLKYRVAGRQRWYTIGRHGAPWTPEEARREAIRLLGEVAAKRDPAEAKNKAKAERTLAELCALYLAEGCATKKASTLATDRGRIERHIKPLLGRLRVKDVTRADVARFQRDVAAGKTAVDVRTGPRGRAIVQGGKGTAARTVGLLGGIFAFAIQEGMRADNPVRGVKRFRDRKGERFLSAGELARLGDALAQAERRGENPVAIAAVRILVLTGCRKSEVLTLQWKHVDFERACLRLPDSKTNEKTVPLGAPALELLASLPRVEGNSHVLPGEKTGGHLVGLQKVWERIRVKADLRDLRLHDLRHTHASIGVAVGLSLPIIGAILGHRDAKTTSRYAHIPDDPLKAAVNRVAGQIASAMNGESEGGADVVELNRKA